MNKYVFPGADASTPLAFVVSSLESCGFEIKHIDTCGVHYSTTLWKWYRNWLANRERVVAKYGERWFRVSFSLRIQGMNKYILINIIYRSGNTSWHLLSSSLAKALPASG